MGIKIGDNNKIKNTNFIENADIKIESKKKKADGFWKQVLVNITSNILWKILGIIFSFAVLVGIAMLANNH